MRHWGFVVSVPVIGAVLFSGCFASSHRSAMPPRVAPSDPHALSAGTAPPGAAVSASLESRVPPAIGGTPFDSKKLTLVLDAPGLEAVAAASVAGDYVQAAEMLEHRLASAPPSPDEASFWQYQIGRLKYLGGDLLGAAAAFDLAAGGEFVLAAYSRFAAAQALVRAGYLDDGMARARSIPEDLPIAPAAHLLIAEALEDKGDHEGALALWREYLSAQRHPPRWIEVALRAAQALLAVEPRGHHGEEAARLVRRVWVEAPTSPSAPRAIELEQHAMAQVAESPSFRAVVLHGKRGTLLPADAARALTPDEQLTRAAALTDAQKNDEADKALDAMLALTPAPLLTDAVLCRAFLLRGTVAFRLRDRARAAELYGRAIARCEGSPRDLVEALYRGGKASAASAHCEEAIERFGAVERRFPTHRYADDARLHAAECALELGDEGRYEAMVLALPNDYPHGDMPGEGLFQLALRRMARGDWAGAVAPLTRARDFPSPDRAYGGDARASYFLARAHAMLGERDRAVNELRNIVREYPLSYYMLCAYARLLELDPGAAAKAIETGMASEPRGAFVLADRPALHAPAFLRGIALLREGELDLGRRELATVDPALDGQNEVVWASATLYAKNGALPLANGLLRARATDWLSHYPAGAWREAWELLYPRPFADVVEREAKRNGIPVALAYGIMREESSFDPDAVSPARAYGLMQLIVPTAKKIARDLGMPGCDEDALQRPEINVALGCKFLADLRAKFAGNEDVAISAYNAGPGAARRWTAARAGSDFDLWVEQIPFEETRRYTKRVLTSYGAYRFLYESNGSAGGIVPLPKTLTGPTG